ncbi:unnamed protein product [Orchesella dallaii]|uniref:Uncharacterized protein n=1 Tax=Orchesella dallaii TaxID=48710 RepID=A0ABP1RA75_9HEXA
MADENENEYSVNREIKKAKEKCWDYSGSGGYPYTVAFSTSREIKLVGLKFYGPAKEASGSYLVRYKVVRNEEVHEEWPGLCNWIGQTFISCVANFLDVWDVLGPGPYVREVELYRGSSPTGLPNVNKGEIFTVRLEKPVLIQPNLMTEIKFELEGPKTEYGEVRYDPIQVLLNDDTQVTFNFLRGSCQIPEILFTV